MIGHTGEIEATPLVLTGIGYNNVLQSSTNQATTVVTVVLSIASADSPCNNGNLSKTRHTLVEFAS